MARFSRSPNAASRDPASLDSFMILPLASALIVLLGAAQRPVQPPAPPSAPAEPPGVPAEAHRRPVAGPAHAEAVGLSREAAEAEARRLWEAHAEALREARREELAAEVVRAAGHEMRFLRRDFGEAPAGGRSLWISMHGGGGAPAEVNDQQWRNQIRLYEPAEGIYIAPRAPSNEWNLWHRSEIDALFDRLIESAVIVWGVDPNRVYLMGYSAGGDGVYQLAPRMADRFAAAAMMAGHPNDASPEGLRNLPFAVFMGGDDGAYNRNSVAKAWGERLDALQAADPGGYPHRVTIYPGLGHWMERKDAEALPWMAGQTRDPWPRTVVWKQGNTPHVRFFWPAVPEAEAVKGRTIRATVKGQAIELVVDPPEARGAEGAPGADRRGEAAAPAWTIELLLSDALIDLDKPVTVSVNGSEVYHARVPRTAEAIAESLRLRPDPAMIATARLRVRLGDHEAKARP